MILLSLIYRFYFIFLLISLINFWFISPALSAEVIPFNKKIISQQIPAIQWLLDQIVPNEIVPLPIQQRRKLILSYRVPPDHPVYPYLSGRSYVYDNALAVVAFTMTKHYREAESILLALDRLTSSEGTLWFGYNTHNNWPSSSDFDGAIQRSGATAWVGYSVVYYLQKRMEENSNFLLYDPLAKKFLQLANIIANSLISRQILDKNDLRYGLITGGTGTYELKFYSDSKTTKEEYNDSPVTWISSEHNIDAYFFLRDLARITGNPVFKFSSTLIGTELVRIWDLNSGQFFQGIKKSQRIDKYLPLDTASWGSFFLMAIGEHQKAKISLEATKHFYSTTGKSLRGYAPYYREPVYENQQINSHYYLNNPGMTWSELQFIWGEGSLGVAAAFAKMGNRIKAQKIIEDLRDLEEGGGIRYASKEIPFQFSTFPSVASTAWLIIASQLLINPNDLFWGD